MLTPLSRIVSVKSTTSDVVVLSLIVVIVGGT
jgi:hypothetical protein